jgi:hypothetical protein
MRFDYNCRRPFEAAATLAVVLLAARPEAAQVTEVVVGLTPSCPYGLSACWGGAREGLERLKGVVSVAAVPDAYNSTAAVRLKGDGLPDVDGWAKQFKEHVGNVYVFRGVELTADATVRDKDGVLLLEVPGAGQELPLAKLEHKLQWNFKKGARRQPEPDEAAAYEQLAAKVRAAKAGLRIQVTGPLWKTAKGYVLEVREFSLEEANRGAR